MGPSCRLQLQHCQFSFGFTLWFSSMHVLFGYNGTNCCYTQVLTLMEPNQDRVYLCGRSKSVTPFARLFISSDDERDPEYVPPGTSIPSRAARATRATPKKLAFGIVTTSQSDEERTLTGTPSGSATHEKGASGSLGVSWLEEASRSAEVLAPRHRCLV